MYEAFTLVIIAATFLLAGTIKGVIGLGLPTVSVALLTIAIDLPSAMALLLAPSLITNVWQALAGGNTRSIFRRIWPFLIMATIMVWVGAIALTRIDISLLSAFLGILLVAYSITSLFGLRINITARRETWVGPVLGAVNGVLTGMTGSFVVPGVLFLQAIGLAKDQLIQAMGMLFTVSTLALAIALKGNNLLSTELGIISAVALLPACIGMVAGQRVRQTLPERAFRRVFFIALLVLGFYITVSAL